MGNPENQSNQDKKKINKAEQEKINVDIQKANEENVLKSTVVPDLNNLVQTIPLAKTDQLEGNNKAEILKNKILMYGTGVEAPDVKAHDDANKSYTKEKKEINEFIDKYFNVENSKINVPINENMIMQFDWSLLADGTGQIYDELTHVLSMSVKNPQVLIKGNKQDGIPQKLLIEKARIILGEIFKKVYVDYGPLQGYQVNSVDVQILDAEGKIIPIDKYIDPIPPKRNAAGDKKTKKSINDYIDPIPPKRNATGNKGIKKSVDNYIDPIPTKRNASADKEIKKSFDNYFDYKSKINVPINGNVTIQFDRNIRPDGTGQVYDRLTHVLSLSVKNPQVLIKGNKQDGIPQNVLIEEARLALGEIFKRVYVASVLGEQVDSVDVQILDAQGKIIPVNQQLLKQIKIEKK